MSIECKTIDQIANNEANKLIASFEMEVDTNIQDLIGYRADAERVYADNTKIGKVALSSYNSLYDTLKQHFMDSAPSVGYDIYNIEMRIRGFKDYIQQMIGKPEAKVKGYAAAVPPRRMIAVAKLLKDIISKQKTRYGKAKALNGIERALLPATIFAYKTDTFGYIYKYIQMTTTLLEEHRRKSDKYKTSYNNVLTDLMQGINNIIATHGNIYTKEWVMDGVPIQMGDKSVIFHGSRRDKIGAIFHKIIDEAKDPDKIIEVSESALSDANIQAGILDKYSNEFLNNLLHGEVRKVEWFDTPVSKEHKVYISNVLNKIKTKSSNPHDASMGIPEVHELEYRGRTFKYVMVSDFKLQPNGAMEEIHHAYIIGHKTPEGEKVLYYTHGDKARGKWSVKKYPKVFKDGFYKAKEYKTFGRRLDENNNLLASSERNYSFGNTTNAYMNQPHSSIMNLFSKTSEHGIKQKSIWDALQGVRDLYSKIFVSFKGRASKEEADINEWFGKEKDGKSKIEKVLGKWFEAKDLAKLMNKLKTLFDIHKRFWTDKKGKVHTPNAQLQKIKSNYGPILYESHAIDRMLETAISNMEQRLEATRKDLTDKEIDEFEKQIEQFKIAQERRNQKFVRPEPTDDVAPHSSGQTIAERNVYTKHRVDWTNPTLRRKDNQVHEEYLDNVFYSLQKNTLMIAMIKTLNSVSLATKEGEPFPTDIVDYLITRTKTVFGDPTAQAGIGSIDYSYQSTANLLNKMPGKRTWDAESAERLIRHTKSLISTMLLGSHTAMVNRTQITNVIISHGWNAMSEARKILANEDKSQPLAKWDAIIAHVGTDETLNMVMDVLSHAGDIKFSDAMLLDIPYLPPVPTPTLKRYFQFIIRNRKSYIKNGIPALDMRLERIELDKITNDKRRIKLKTEKAIAALKKSDKRKAQKTLGLFAKEEKRLSGIEARNVQALRENFIDLLFTPRSDNKRIVLEAKFKRIIGEVTDNRLKRSVSWKLSFWWKGWGSKLFTITEGERHMRKMAVVMSLLAAQRSGHLGAAQSMVSIDPHTNKPIVDPVSGLPVEIEDIFFSEEAVRIARNTVYNTMFGMSAGYLGDAFGGLGAQLGLYKAYPVQQMLHDNRVIESTAAGSLNKIENITRLKNAASDAMVRSVKGIKYNPGDPHLDHEAISMLRLLLSRISWTGLAISIETIPFLRNFIRSPMSKQFSTMIRGGENPGLALATRLLVNSIMFSIIDDDDEMEKGMIDMITDFARLLLPVFFTLPLTMAYQEYKNPSLVTKVFQNLLDS